MKTFASAAALLLLVAVSTNTFAQRKTTEQPKRFSFNVAVEGVSSGEVSLKAADARGFESAVDGDVSPWCRIWGCVATYHMDSWPTSAQLEGLKASKTHVISSGNRKLKLGGIDGMKINSVKKSATFNFKSCE